MPGRKNVYRLYGADGTALVDLLQQPHEAAIVQGVRVLCRHPFVVGFSFCTLFKNIYNLFSYFVKITEQITNRPRNVPPTCGAITEKFTSNLWCCN